MPGQTLATADGYCLAFGGSNAREGWIRGDDIDGFMSERTQERPSEFFGWMAGRLLQAHAGGAEWGVIGLPGPVQERGAVTLIGPFANLADLKEQYDIRAKLIEANSDCTKLFAEGFRLLVTNDGNLVAHAAAARFGKGHERIGALINGTGVGFGAVQRISPKSDVFETIKFELEIGHAPIDDLNPTVTYENTISGTALEARASKDGHRIRPEALPADHPLWREVGRRQGRIIMTMALLMGVDLVVPTGGVGVGAADKYKAHLDTYLAEVRAHGNATQRYFVPEVAYVPSAEAHTFELHGARSVLRSSLE